MPLTTAGRNALLDSGKAAFTHVSAYSDLGTTEVASSRVAVTWTAAASGATDNNAQLSIPIPAAGVVQSVTVHSAVSGGTLYGWFPYGSTGQVKYGVGTAATSDLITSNGHGLTTDDRVFVWGVADEALPTGLAAATLYYVLAAGLTTDVFALSATSGGAAVNITAVGETAWAKTVPNTFASAGNLVIATGDLDLSLTFA